MSDARESFASIEMEDVVEDAPPSEGEIDVDIDFEDDASPGSVQNILSITGESWSLDAQRADLKEAARDRTTSNLADVPSAPALSIPTPYDLGGLERPSTPATPAAPAAPAVRRSIPPPLPASAMPPPLPSARPSAPPTSDGRLASSSKAPASLKPPAPRSVPPPPRTQPASVPPPPRTGDSRRPPSLPRADAPSRPDERGLSSEAAALVDLLGARIERLEKSDDRVGLARAWVELAIVHETSGDDAKVNASAERALDVEPDLAVAHNILRRRIHARTQLVPMLRHLERELLGATNDAASVELLAEKARLFDAGAQHDQARDAWEQALARVPHHAAALKALEGILVRATSERPTDRDAWEDLVAHLSRMADAYASQPALAAWLHLERARILDLRVGNVDGARGAFDRALRLAPGVSPVRDAAVLHAAAHGDAARLSILLEEEATIESDGARCARLELDAACIAHVALRDDARAIALLDRAAGRAPTTPSVDRRVMDELVRLHELAGEWPEAARARRSRLRFFEEPAVLAYELRRLASAEERLGNLQAAAADLERAVGLSSDDPSLASELDRVLMLAGRHDERIALWNGEAQRATDPSRRAKALVRAARLAEELGDVDQALRHLRTAWVAKPGEGEVLDPLARLMSPSHGESFGRDARALVELYAQAAQATDDAGRRIAYLEKVAVLWEEVLGDPARAARVYEEILALEPGRRGAVLGLGRAAAASGDDRALSRALVEEAKLAGAGPASRALRIRAAETLRAVDATRATALLGAVLDEEPGNLEARALETRLHEEAGRWELAAASLAKRIDLATSARERVALRLALAEMQSSRLRLPHDAVTTLRAARTDDPVHPVPPEEVVRVLEAVDEPAALRLAIEQLAEDAITPQERARHLLHAGEIAELRLADDARAVSLYQRALAETPDDALAEGRLLRVLARRAVTTAGGAGPNVVETDAFKELLATLARKADARARATHALAPNEEHAAAFQLASLLVASGDDGTRAVPVLERLVAALEREPGVLRMLEAVGRRSGSHVPVARALRLQGERLLDVRARTGALWELAALETWRLTTGESVSTYASILELDPTDPSGLEAAVRLSLGPARQGDGSARRAAISALRSLSALTTDEGSRVAIEVRLSVLLEASARSDVRASRVDGAREALERLRIALALDPLSVTAATSLARLANELGDVPSAVLAAESLAELAAQPAARARYLLDAANLLLGPAPHDGLGERAQRTERAAGLLEKAVDADPSLATAITRLAQVRTAQGLGERVLDPFRAALAKNPARDAVVVLAAEIARAARDELGDLVVAIDAMQKACAVAPDHVPSLLTLSELLIAQRAWPEAVDALQRVVDVGREVPPRVTALFALASVHEKILARPDDAEAALRRALEIDPRNPRAIRALVHRLAAKQDEVPEEEAAAVRAVSRREIATLLERLADEERDRSTRTDILVELADIRLALKDLGAAEKALVEAVANCPSHTRAFARLARLFRKESGNVDAVPYARALAAVIGRGEQLGAVEPRWLHALGHLELVALGRVRDATAHLRRALDLDPMLHTARFELATAFARLGAHEDATKTLHGMIAPSADPLVALEHPTAALELYERSLVASLRQEDAVVVSELRAVSGDLDEGRSTWLRSRRIGPFEGHHTPLDRATLVAHAVPEEGRTVLLEVAGAIAGVEGKILRADLADLGVGSREKVGRRSGHPTRALLDRLQKALGLGDVELAITPLATRTRVITADDTWIVVPRSLTELPEPTQLATLARGLARVALAVPWLEELPPHHMLALLVAAARTVVPTFMDDVDATVKPHVAPFEAALSKELSRRQRQALEKLAPAIAAEATRPLADGTLVAALARAELRVAYLLTGDLLATIDELRGLDPAFFEATAAPGTDALAAVLTHPFAGDVARYALSGEASPLRRRVGSTWSG